jgi:4-alpha-glucanotransferase
MPIYVSYESADCWSNQHLFALNEEGRATEEAGVPPDYFSEDGQRWGNPLYNWSAMKAEGYRWWIDRLQTAGNLFDRVRIDHFRAFSAYWAVPAEAETAKEGQWKQGPGMDFFEVIFQKIDKDLLIAEDLGVQDDALRALLTQTGLPGMRVMQFAFPGMDNGIHLPHNYSANTVAYTGTHDNNTLLGYLWELTPADRRYALDYCGFQGQEWKDGGAKNPAIRAMVRTLWASHAALVMVPVQDLLGYGRDTKMNHPGIAKGNWGYRLTEEAFAQLDPQSYRALSALYNRI